jgi:hypothetical protein
MVVADDDEVRPSLACRDDDLLRRLARGPHVVRLQAGSLHTPLRAAEHGGELGRLGKRDHRRRGVVQRAEVLGPFRVERHLRNGEHDELRTAGPCLVHCAGERAVGGVETVVAHEDRPLPAHRH